MTSRLPGVSRREGVDPAPTVERNVVELRLPQRAPVTEGMVDEAVENVIREQGLMPDLANVLMFNLGKDAAGGVANAYYASKAAARSASVGVKRHDVSVKYVLPDVDVAALVEYAPEFKLQFTSRENHDHPMAAACRMIDHRLIMARLPYGLPTTDVGGNPLVHIRAERANVHVCGPVVDVKDQMRHKLRVMEARRMSKDASKPAVADLAQRFLDKDPAIVCDKVAQQCGHQSSILTSIHVYDIEIDAWPSIMQMKGAALVEGCLLFSDRFFEHTAGELSVSKVRYEIDIQADKFEMGFSRSPSWWYSHTWSKYMLYGADQILYAGDVAYSYKVIERRGDTLFFRIIRLDEGVTKRPSFASRRMPGIPLVQVNGFALNPDTSAFASAMRRQVYQFPRSLWYEMVSQASEDYERGVMDFTRMYNHYRTVSVRQTINAVLVMGGDPVSPELLVPLVTHACLAAAAQSTLGQRTTRGITDASMFQRRRADERTVTKLANMLRDLVKNVLLVPLIPFKVLSGLLARWSIETYEQWLLDWEPVVRDVIVPVGRLQVSPSTSQHTRSAVSIMKQFAASTSAFDHYAAVVSDTRLHGMLTALNPHVIVPPTPKLRDEDEESRTTAPTYVSVENAESEVAIRRAAIVEHMDEITMGNRAVSDVCKRAYNELLVRGEPSIALLRKRAELYRNPDFWRVRNGTLVESMLGLPISDFHHSAVYTVMSDPDTHSNIRSVHRSEWRASIEQGQELHVNYSIADVNFSGWVMVTDDLIIHNGPEILASMEASLALPHDYSVIVHRAPPGSGKTYSIVHSVKPDGTDVVMCPVRESIEDTRSQIVTLHQGFPNPKLNVRTVDSFLTNLNVHERTRLLKADRLLADECYMTHAGKWYAVAALLGVKEVHAYGDEKQIPHIPRVQAAKLHVKLRSQQVDDVWTTRRCPPSAVAAWGEVYHWRVRSMSDQVHATMDAVTDVKGVEIPNGCVMMCMYQADKMLLRQKYAQSMSKIKILTAHEAEGKTYKHVWLHRFDMRRRTDNMSLFDQQPHVLVAMSRHTHSFKYVRPANLGDLVDRWIVSSKDFRRLAAAADVTSAGESKEKL